MTSRRFLAIATALALLLTTLAYGRVVPGFFLGDDFGGLALFRDLRAGELWSVFRIWEGQGHWRPLWALLFWCVHQVCGLWAPGYHLVALLLHASCGVLLALLLRRLGAPPAAALWACALFLLHPSQAPSLGWIASVQEPLVTSACLLALLLQLRFQATGGMGNALLAVAAAAAALAAKEAAVGLLPAAVVLWWCAPQRGGRRGVLVLVQVALVVGYLWLRVATRSLPAGGALPMAGAAGQLLADGAAWGLGLGDPWSGGLVAALALWGVGTAAAHPRGPLVVGLLLLALGFLLPQLPAYTGFTPVNTRLLHTVLAGVAALLAVALVPRRGGHVVLAGLALTGAFCGQQRLQPFVTAGQLSRTYHEQLLRLVPPGSLPADGQVLAFFTNEVPLPPGVAPADYRFFWPPFGQMELAVQLGLRLPQPLFLRPDPGPGTVQAAAAEFGAILLVEIAGKADRAEYLRFIQERGRKLTPDPHIVVLYWDQARQALERLPDAAVFGR